MVPSTLIRALASDANLEIAHVLRHGAPGHRVPTTEVGFVAAVVIGAVPGIAARWQHHLAPHGFTVQIHSVFCHASPMVDFSPTGRALGPTTVTRELGDLLIVHDDLSTGSATDRQAVLIQAKRSRSGTVRRPDAHQLHLYNQWPVFQATHGTFPPGTRDFTSASTPGGLQDCGRYGIIRTGIRTPDWLLVTPGTPPLSSATGGVHLGAFMAEMLGGPASGRGRQAIISGADDWSKTIDDLLKVTFAHHFTHTATLGPGVTRPRGTTATTLIHLGKSAHVQLISLITDYDRVPPEVLGAGGVPLGISTIYIRTTRDAGHV